MHYWRWQEGATSRISRPESVPTWIRILHWIIIDVGITVKALRPLIRWHDGVSLHEPAQLRIIPSSIVEIYVAFSHLPGIGIVCRAGALSVSGRPPGVVESSTYLTSIRIRHRADAPQLIAIKIIDRPILLHRNALPIHIEVQGPEAGCDRFKVYSSCGYYW